MHCQARWALLDAGLDVRNALEKFACTDTATRLSLKSLNAPVNRHAPDHGRAPVLRSLEGRGRRAVRVLSPENDDARPYNRDR